MRILRIVSIVLLVITLAGFILWRFVIPFPAWLVRVNGILMLITIFTSVYSAVRLTKHKT